MEDQDKSAKELMLELQECRQKYKALSDLYNKDISERKKIEDILSANLYLLNSIISSTSDAIYAKDLKGRYTLANNAVEKAVGKKSIDIIGKDDYSLFPEAEAKVVMEGDRKVMEGSSPVTYEEQVTIANGTKTLYLSTKGPLFDAYGKPSGLFGIVRDITERKQSELLLKEKVDEIESQNEEYLQLNEELNQTIEELVTAKEKVEENESKFRAIFENSMDAIGISQNGINILFNKAYLTLFGYENESEIIGKSLLNQISPKEHPRILEYIQKRSKGEFAPTFYETIGIRKNGEEFPFEVKAGGYLHNNEKFTTTIIRDISERKKTARALVQSEEKFRKAFFTNPESITINRLSDGMYVSVNTGFTQILEYTQDEALGKTSLELNIWQNSDGRKQFIHTLNTKGVVENLEAKFNTKSGQQIDTLVSAALIELEGMPHILSITRDISDRKRAELEILKSKEKAERSEQKLKAKNDELNRSLHQLSDLEKRLQFALTSSQIGAWDLDVNGNSSIRTIEHDKIFGYSSLIPKWNYEIFMQHIIADDREQVNNLFQHANKQKTVCNFECRIRRADGIIRWIWACGQPQYDETGNIARMSGVVQDITERKHAELLLVSQRSEIEIQNEEYQQLNEELIQSNEEMQQINEELESAKLRAEESDRLKTAFLQNMSHEIRTPMNAIMGFSELMKEAYNNKPKLEKFSEIISQRCNDLLDIINDILDIAKIESGQLSVKIHECNLNLLFEELSAFFNEYQNRLGKQHIKLSLSSLCNPPENVIFTDKVKLKQVFINLINNAFKFTNEGSIEGGCKFDENRNLLFYVSDTGMGIPPDKQKVIFDRFTQLNPGVNKSVSGTGLGLSIVKGLINLLGGEIFLKSIPGEGSTFSFTIPLKPIDSLQYESSEFELPTTKNLSDKTILIVDDDFYNIEYLKEVLSDTGVTILQAENGKSAIEISINQSVDLVLMDIRLPDLDGYEATRQIRQHKLKLKIIVQTAYAAHDEIDKALKAGCNDYLCKPIKKEILLSMVNKHLAKR